METIEIIIIIFSFITGILCVSLAKQCIVIKDLKLQKTIAENEVKIAENMYRNQISILQGQINSLLKIKTVQTTNVSKDTVQAVKYAMKHAHPDNGGNAEDFMKFKKCYEELTRK